jgi:protein-tyrosine kinase
MSIVERALRKAQLAARLATGQPVVSPAASVPRTSPLAATAYGSSSRQERGADHLSPTLRNPKPIVEIPVDRLRAEGRLPSADIARQTDEEMRRIKWPLLHAIQGRGGAVPTRNNVILVTSAVAGEGKSFTSLNLALSIARDRELWVILVDGDVARSGLTPALGLVDRPGLNDVLDDASLDVSSVTYQTDVDGLFFVPAGKWHEQSAVLFAGSRMPQVIEALGERVGNGVIILDSPPLLATNEAQAVTRYVGQVLLVVRADSTEQRTVLDAIALVDKSTPVSAILNWVEDTALRKYYDQYHYGDGQTYGSADGRRRQSGKGDV